MDWLELCKLLLGILTVILSLGYTIRHFKAIRTISYIERFNTPSMIETRAIVEKWSNLDDGEKMKQLENDIDLFYRINLIYNIITEIGISYKYRIIDRKLACEVFYPLIPLWSKKIHPYIFFRRNRGERFGFYLELINKAISTHHEKYPKKYELIERLPKK